MTKKDTIPTLADELGSKGVSWKFYTTSLDSSNNYLNSFPDVNKAAPDPSMMIPDPSGVKTGASSFDNDATGAMVGKIQRHLPSFSWLVAPTSESEHPGVSTTCDGENWVSDRINAVERGPDWSSSVIVLTWDDYGGFYDHIAPKNVDKLGYGFRVPFLIISPFTRHHISSKIYDFTSILKLAEDRWSLDPLSARDKAAKSIAADLDFSATNKPLTLSPVPAKLCS